MGVEWIVSSTVRPVLWCSPAVGTSQPKGETPRKARRTRNSNGAASLSIGRAGKSNFSAAPSRHIKIHLNPITPATGRFLDGRILFWENGKKRGSAGIEGCQVNRVKKGRREKKFSDVRRHVKLPRPVQPVINQERHPDWIDQGRVKRNEKRRIKRSFQRQVICLSWYFCTGEERTKDRPKEPEGVYIKSPSKRKKKERKKDEKKPFTNTQRPKPARQARR